MLGIQQAKSSLRKEIKNRLTKLSKESIHNQSLDITNQLLKSDYYKQCNRIGIYLSMPEEVQTDNIIKDIFNSGKECFIPRYTKLNMDMVKLKSLEDLENLPFTKWNIKQPLETEDREDAYLNGGLDLVVVPGLAFTKEGDRLGRGKGYYDKYLTKMKEYQEENNLKPFVSIGLAFKEQIVHEIPTTREDFKISEILFPRS